MFAGGSIKKGKRNTKSNRRIKSYRETKLKLRRIKSRRVRFRRTYSLKYPKE